MERKLAQYTTIFICSFSLFACMAVWFLPTLEQRIKAFSVSIRQEQLAREERYALLKEMSGLEIMDYNTQQVQQEQAERELELAKQELSEEPDEKEPVEEVIAITHQMQLELPSGANASNVEIRENHVARQVDIKIPGADENYIYDYMVLGESDAMESLDYSSEGGSGTVALVMDKIVEVDSSFHDGYLYLDFLSPEDIHDRILVVDAGHGGSAPGAVSGARYEKNITLAIVQQVKALFDEADDTRIGVYYTRLDDTNPSLSDRVGLANDLGADLFLSVHINSMKGNDGVEGVEVMYNELAPDTAFDTKDFAQICLDEEVAALGAKKRKLIDGNRIHIIRNSAAPAALIEVGFMNNPRELERLMEPSYQRKAAEGIYHALLKSLGRLDEIDREAKGKGGK